MERAGAAVPSCRAQIGFHVFASGGIRPNGARKSTLMRWIATLQTPTSGGIRFGEIGVITEPEKLRERLGYLPQDSDV
ncbi:ATP-binding cassette domain-containing protein [Sphingomonas koreensis]|nr:ATP-binding cassette domain-containing protein [Sphingomonas koreensis]